MRRLQKGVRMTGCQGLGGALVQLWELGQKRLGTETETGAIGRIMRFLVLV